MALNLKTKVKVDFFDSPKVMRAIDKGTRKALSYFGSAVRKHARKSIGSVSKPRASGISTPPRPAPAPPRARTTHPYASIKNILFHYDHGSKSVVIGPIRFGAKVEGGKTVPQLLTEGGSATLHIKRLPLKTKANKAKKSKRMVWVNSKKFPGIRVFYRKRPFMITSFGEKQKELKKQMKDMMHK